MLEKKNVYLEILIHLIILILNIKKSKMKNIKSIFFLTKRTLNTSSNLSGFNCSKLLSFPLKTFSTIRLKTHTNTLEYQIKSETADSKLKNYLSKNWVLLKHSFKHNKIAKDSNFSTELVRTPAERLSSAATAMALRLHFLSEWFSNKSSI